MLNYFLNIQKELLHAYENSKRLKHNVVKGSEREIIISHFLHRHIPNRVEVGSGMIVDQQTTSMKLTEIPVRKLIFYWQMSFVQI